MFDYSILLKYAKLIDIGRLKNEISSFINYKLNYNQINWLDLNTLIKQFVEKDLRFIYEEIFKLLKIYLTIPVTSAEPERAFSV